MIWFTSDLHLFHDREFIWKARGFNSVDEMNEAIVERFNSCVKPEDETFILGDLMLGQKPDEGIKLLTSLNGYKFVIAGNHDTPARRKRYQEAGWTVYDAFAIKLGGYHFYLSHYPTLTANLEKESLKQCTLNLYGHTHQTTNFFEDRPYMYHVGVDSHDCRPVNLDEVITEMKQKYNECLSYL